ncbi:MAG: FKBP-type peptidyl-prolyl cis-trans isomerase [Lachnospiraceae bacterium]
MTLGEYKGLEVSKIKTEISDDDIEQEISYTLDDSTEYNEVDRAAEDGDMVNITYSSTMDGEDFDGGSGEDVDIELGAGYLEGDILQDAESQIIGMKAGDTKEMDLTIPEDYYFDDTLAGQSIQVTLTVNTVSEVNRPELTDEFVASISDFDTVDAYKEDLKRLWKLPQRKTTSTWPAATLSLRWWKTVPSRAIPMTSTMSAKISTIRPIRLMPRCSA